MRILFVYFVGFVIMAVLNTAILRAGGEEIEEAKIAGATLAIFWFCELPLILIVWLTGKVVKNKK